MPKIAEQVLEVRGPAVGHRGRGHGVFQDQVPADDPGEQLAERRVGVGVGRARHRHHGGELGVAQGREHAGEARGDEGEHQGGPGLVVRGHAGEHEDAGADDGPDAEARQLHRTEDAAEPVLSLGLLQKQFQRFAGKELVGHSSGKHRGGPAKVNLRPRMQKMVSGPNLRTVCFGAASEGVTRLRGMKRVRFEHGVPSTPGTPLVLKWDGMAGAFTPTSTVAIKRGSNVDGFGVDAGGRLSRLRPKSAGRRGSRDP